MDYCPVFVGAGGGGLKLESMMTATIVDELTDTKSDKKTKNAEAGHCEYSGGILGHGRPCDDWSVDY